jgi:hypothetical protein
VLSQHEATDSASRPLTGFGVSEATTGRGSRSLSTSYDESIGER